ncbi:MAG TPA: hypothetical protein VHT00_14050 [Stellaceae bacterium]|jgi:hypothetical protein|nr:hypothetical protein [Stellaceae bacterium]
MTADDPKANWVWCRLTPSEIHIASLVGLQRSLAAIRDQTPGRYGRPEGPGFDENINGACGEISLARFLKCYWNGAYGNRAAADVGTFHQVRASGYDGPNAGLILHKPDADDQPFVKAFVRLPHVALVGWIYARDGKKSELWGEVKKGREPCFLVPHAMLLPMSSLPQDEA